MQTPFGQIEAVLFDKDGTLFDFSASWSGWAGSVLDHLSQGVAARKTAVAEAMGYDLRSAAFHPGSPVIAGTLAETAELILPHLPDWSRTALIRYLDAAAESAHMSPPVPLAPLLAQLQGAGLVLGVATNDSEAAAIAHLDRAGVGAAFAQVLGYDSGFTPKPAPDMLLGFADRADIAPARVLMVGDSLHDLRAAQAAGMPGIGVLTGLADHATLAPLSRDVLPDIGHLPRALGLA